MDQKDQNLQEFDLEDILKEFGAIDPDPSPAVAPEAPAEAAPAEEATEAEAAPEPEAPAEVEAAGSEEAPAEAEEAAAPEEATATPQKAPANAVPVDEPSDVTRDTIRLDSLAEVIGHTEAPAEAEKEVPEVTATQVLPQVSETLGEFAPPPPIPFRSPRARLRELKRKLVAGPEKRYYELAELGLGKLQIAILLNVIVVLVCAGATAMFACGLVPGNRIRLMVFSQVLAMLVSALLGSNCLIEGIADLFKPRFSMNTMLAFSFLACCADAVFCLMEQRVPCCAAFCLAMTMALCNRYQERNTEMGQMDTLRKAVRLDSVVKVEDFYEGRSGLIKGEGQVEHFMDNYALPTTPEKIQRWFAFISFLACIGIAVFTGLLHGSISLAVQIFSTSLLVAVPASFFVALSRPMGVLERRLHMVGTVICGWKGVKGLCGKAAFPLSDADIFPVGSTKLNGVKFYGDRKPDQIISYAAALIRESGGGLEPVFSQLMKSRGCDRYEADSFRDHGNGGIGGEVLGESVLLGTPDFLQEMGVEIPEGSMVSQAVYCAIDGQLCAVFAIAYGKMKSAAAGLVTLCGYRKLTPVVTCGDFMVTESFLRSKFGISTRRIAFPDQDIRIALSQRRPEPDKVALALTTHDGLAPTAYAVTGARALRTACTLGLILHMLGGILGMLIMLTLAYLGSAELLTPVNVLLYQLVWMVPGLLFTEWTRTV